MLRKFVPIGLSVLATVALASGLAAARGTENEPSIKEVMKVAMKGGLAKTAIEGKASAEQKDELLKLMKALADAKPPRGDAKSWTDKTKALVDATQSLVEGKADAGASLKTAVNCKSCHDLHKGE